MVPPGPARGRRALKSKQPKPPSHPDTIPTERPVVHGGGGWPTHSFSIGAGLDGPPPIHGSGATRANGPTKKLKHNDIIDGTNRDYCAAKACSGASYVGCADAYLSLSPIMSAAASLLKVASCFSEHCALVGMKDVIPPHRQSKVFLDRGCRAWTPLIIQVEIPWRITESHRGIHPDSPICPPQV